MQNLMKERKQSPVLILQQVIFYNIFILPLWLFHEFFINMYFLAILVIFKEYVY